MHISRRNLEQMNDQRGNYILHHLPQHLAEQGDKERLETLLWMFDFLQAKLDYTVQGTHELTTDLDMVPDDAELQRVRGVLQRSRHILDQDPQQLGGQLLGRLLLHYGNVERLTTLLERCG